MTPANTNTLIGVVAMAINSSVVKLKPCCCLKEINQKSRKQILCETTGSYLPAANEMKHGRIALGSENNCIA